MDNKIIKILDEFIDKFGSDLLPRLNGIETEGMNLANELEKLDQVREDPKYHGDVSTLQHAMEVVELLKRLYAFIYNQERDEKLNIAALENALNILPNKLGTHLERKIGRHTRKELLFFACIFHDIGKLKNFTHIMEEVERENVKGVTRFIFHADYGRMYFEDEISAIDEVIKHYQEKEKEYQDNPTRKKFYEQVMTYLNELKSTFDARKEFFQKLELGSEERKYIAFLIRNHMDLLNFFNQFSTAYKSKDDKNGPKLMANFVKNMLKKSDEYGEHYVDCILLNFCDLLESSHSAGIPTGEMYIFFHTCMLVHVNSAGLKEGGRIYFKGDEPAFEAKQKPKYNFGNLFKNFPKDEALKIKQLLENAPDLKAALKSAGYDDHRIEEIMVIIAK